jgi:hypothetical protein|tara:strand:+ start:16 stop:723 length:708 start_codon:yes stop_codon:yes gene_type:complete
MARISTYPIDTDVVGSDMLVGTDFSGGRVGATKNFTIDSLSVYIKESIAIAGQMRYKYVAIPETGLGNFSLPTGGVNNKSFSAITSIVIAVQDRTPQNVVKFLEYLVNSDIYIGEREEVSTFGHYKVTGYTISGTNTNFYNLTLTFLGGNGSLQLDSIYEIINFVKADAAGDLNFTFTQVAPALVWAVNHNLGKNPSVSIVDPNDQEVFAQVNYIDTNSLTITFSSAQAGKAYIN